MKKLLVIIAVLIAVLFWAVAQPAAPGIDAYIPAGALLYVESRNFSALLTDWNASQEKALWLQSANYQVFSRSRLLLRLKQAQDEFAASAGVSPDFALLQAVAGTQSALAVYSIGDLEFLYVTRMPLAQASATSLWQARSGYQQRTAANTPFFLKQDPASKRVTAIAVVRDLLVVATRESLMAGALSLIAGQQQPAMRTERWFTEAVRAAPQGGRDLRMIMNLERLARTAHFRSYWIQRNASSIGEFYAGISDLERAAGEIRERRVFLRAQASADRTDVEAAAGQARKLIPPEAGLFRVWAAADTQSAVALIEDRVFGAAVGPAVQSKLAPLVTAEGSAGSEDDLESRIDQPPLVDDRVSMALEPLRKLFGGPRIAAMAYAGSSRAITGDVFTGTQDVIAIIGDQPWDEAAVRSAFGAAGAAYWTAGTAGAGWTRRGGRYDLDGLARLSVAINGNLLVCGNSPEFVDAVLARTNAAAVPGAIYAAGWRHSRELPSFERMMRLIDHPQIQTPADEPDAREPMFFSENVAGLGRVLGRLESAAIEVHDRGASLSQNVTYRLVR